MLDGQTAHANISQSTNKMATHRNILEINCSSSYWADPRGAEITILTYKIIELKMNTI